MKSIIQAIKSINIRQILTVFFAGCLLIVSTACSKDSVAQSPNKAGMEASRAASNTYDDYDAKEDAKGGMNKYNDDRRYDAETAAKAKSLIDSAKRRQSKGYADNVDDLPEVIGDKFNEAKREIPRAINNRTEEASEYLQNKSDKLQRNLEKVPAGAKNVFDEATDTAQGALQDASKAASKNTREVKSNFKDLS